MSDAVIKVSDLGKKYRLSHQSGAGGKPQYRRFSDFLINAIRRPFRRGGGAVASQEEFWALQGVSFEVKRGEVIGVIGRNGAGKSTLLKILSRITEPSVGEIEINGRVVSLLEVGTGFHPELTGRENIFLNGAILGMTRAEISRKFEEIVAFAEVERFLDTPVKHYSSGMYVRLAFSVAAHLEPEILIIDEVLAVGDAAFQKKCLGKMRDVASSEGRTVLFVSHNMSAVLALCSRCILMQKGRLAAEGRPSDLIEKYFRPDYEQESIVDLTTKPREFETRNEAVLNQIWMINRENIIEWKIGFGEPPHFFVGIHLKRPVVNLVIGVAFQTSTGFEVASSTSFDALRSNNLVSGDYVIEVRYRNFCPMIGSYRIGISLTSDKGLEDYVGEAANLEVVTSELATQLGVSSFRGAVVPEVFYNIKNQSTKKNQS